MRFIALPLGALLAACSTTEPAPAWITTDSVAYTARLVPGSTSTYTLRVVTRFVNRGRTDVYLGRCFPNSPRPMYIIGAETQSESQSAYNPAWGCVGHDKQFLVAPGQARADTFDLTGPNICRASPPVCEGLLEGRFRIAFMLRNSSGDGTDVDFGKASNPFAISLDTR